MKKSTLNLKSFQLLSKKKQKNIYGGAKIPLNGGMANTTPLTPLKTVVSWRCWNRITSQYDIIYNVGNPGVEDFQGYEYCQPVIQ
ncbi:hypothetical protein NH341_14455 [Tenacibaculum sp. XPcli2-G]|uniref:hypothetical protein n=1 Tax=Tenacibaculum sp. XPcli2-G TaxID=2954503 RepID=UPI0020984247|nr:hypothetical protein [Tenacibaculum sp. XPcli2-G]MCO7186620.1 hypothetical protein [Tenacibaculum sp. XPcli2-G]